MSPKSTVCPQPTEFAQLIRRIQAGDDSAMTQICEKYGAAMRRTARELIGRSLRSHLDSVDLVQSVQLMLWLGLRTGKFSTPSPDNLLALASTLLKRKVARYCRKFKQDMNCTIEGNLNGTLIDEMLIPTTSYTNPAHDTDLDDMVEHFTSQLSELDRRLVSLRLEGYSTADVARRLNVDAGLLRVRLGRLRLRFANFRELLAKTNVRVPTEDAIV